MSSGQEVEQGSVDQLNGDIGKLKVGLKGAEGELIETSREADEHSLTSNNEGSNLNSLEAEKSDESLKDSIEKDRNVTQKLPVQDSVVIDALRNRDDATTNGCRVEICDDGSVTVTGTEENTKHCVEMLAVMYGLSLDGPSTATNGATSLAAAVPISNAPRPSSSSASATLTLKPPEQAATSEPRTSSEDGTLGVDELMWSWIQKDKEEKSKVEGLLAEHGVSIEVTTPQVQDDDELEMYERSVQLVLNGEAVEKCRTALKALVDRCGNYLVRKKGSCNEEAYQRLTKMLPSINKGACQVGVSNKSITVVGKKDDVEASAAKLLRYGVRFEGMMTDEDRRQAEERKPRENPFANFVPPGAQNPMIQGAFPGGQQAFRQGQPQGRNDDAADIEALTLQAASLNSEDGRQVCIPVEKILWRYIDHSKQAELAELRDGFGVFIRQNEVSTTGNRASDHVFITFSAENAEMVDLGRQAFLQLMEHLHSQINVALIPIKFGGEGMEAAMQGGAGNQQMAQVFQVIKSQCSTEDVLVECTGDGILIISPNHKVQEAQERVTNFMKNLQGAAQQGGAGFPGMGQRLGAGGAQMMGDGFGPGRVSGPGPVIVELPDEDESSQRAQQVKSSSSTAGGATDRSKAQASSSEASSSKKTTELESRARVSESDSSGIQGGYCSACSATPQNSSSECAESGSSCGHSYCLSCIELYFGCKDMECPTCGISTSDNEVNGAGSKRTQPADGVMLVTEDSSFKLPGFDKSSSGTIVITYVFPAGMQSEDMLSPGQKYEGITQTAFLPKNKEGQQIVAMLQKAFDSRILFTYSETGQLAFSGVRHKTNIYGGPQQSGYPDPVYLRRVKTDLLSKRIRLQ